MTLFLFFQTLFQRLHQFVPAAHFFDLRHFFGRQIFFRDGFQPVGGNIDGVLAIFGEDTYEDFAKNLVEAIKQCFVFDQSGARQIVKFFRTLANHVGVQRGK